MANGHQLDIAIKAAAEQLAREGWESADLRLVMLAGFGYLAHEIRRPPWLRLRTLWPAGIAGGGGLGAAVLTLIQRYL